MQIETIISVLIPENSYGIPAGIYPLNSYVGLLRDNKNEPDIIQFLADMLEL